MKFFLPLLFLLTLNPLFSAGESLKNLNDFQFDKTFQKLEPSEKRLYLEEYRAVLFYLSEQSEIDENILHYNLGLSYFYGQEFGKSLYHLNRVSGDEQLWANTKILIKRISALAGSKKTERNGFIEFFTTLATLNFFSRDTKLWILFSFNALLWLGLILFYFFKRRFWIYFSGVNLPIVFYLCLLILFPQITTKKNTAFIIEKNPETFSGPGSFYGKESSDVSDGFEVRIVETKKKWAKVDYQGSSFWLKKDAIIF